MLRLPDRSGIAIVIFGNVAKTAEKLLVIEHFP